MLGAEQSGFIADLGYETYQKILEEAVDELKSEEFADLYADNTEGHRDTGSEYVRETYIESDLELMFPPPTSPTTRNVFPYTGSWIIWRRNVTSSPLRSA